MVCVGGWGGREREREESTCVGKEGRFMGGKKGVRHIGGVVGWVIWP